MPITIIGAGMAGLLAANMLRAHDPIIIERQRSLPNNHSAVLRFRSNTVGDVLGLQFKAVAMTKGHIPWRNPVADSLAYSRKCTGVSRSDRSITSANFETELRFISPTNLINFMASLLGSGKILYNINKVDFGKKPIISTMPMPSLMRALAYPDMPTFTYVNGFNATSKVIHCDAYVSLYVPDPEIQFNRISLTGDELILEYATEKKPRDIDTDFKKALDLLGLEAVSKFPTLHEQKYAKILPIDDRERKRFMAWATDNHNVYSLGRYATWRPKLLLDDLVQDIRLIDSWITSGASTYDARMHRRIG